MTSVDTKSSGMGNTGRLLILLAVIAAVAAVIVVRNLDPNESAGGGAIVADETGLPRLVDLGADKCVPCKMMAPILEELKTDLAGQCEVVFIDVWKNADAGTEYGIRVIPTQVFYDAAGQELFRHEGFFSRQDILATWARFGITFESL